MYHTADDFLAAVRADPADDTPRLVFADWLDESGDPLNARWAAFIRCQIDLARLPPPHKVEDTTIQGAIHLRPHGPRCYEAVFLLPRADAPPPLAVGDRVDIEHTQVGRSRTVRPKHGLRVGRVFDVDPHSYTYRAALYEDDDSVPDPHAADRDRLLARQTELWSSYPDRDDLRTMFHGMMERATAAPCHWVGLPDAAPRDSGWAFVVRRGFVYGVSVRALRHLTNDSLDLATRLAAVPGVQRIEPAGRRPDNQYFADIDNFSAPNLWHWERVHGAFPGDPAGAEEDEPDRPEELPTALFDRVSADPRRAEVPGLTAPERVAAFRDRDTALDALALAVCDTARVRLGLPPLKS